MSKINVVKSLYFEVVYYTAIVNEITAHVKNEILEAILNENI